MPTTTNTSSIEYELNAFGRVHSTLPPIFYIFYLVSKEHFLAPSLFKNYPHDFTLLIKSINTNVCFHVTVSLRNLQLIFSRTSRTNLTNDSCRRTYCSSHIHASQRSVLRCWTEYHCSATNLGGNCH